MSITRSHSRICAGKSIFVCGILDALTSVPQCWVLSLLWLLPGCCLMSRILLNVTSGAPPKLRDLVPAIKMRRDLHDIRRPLGLSNLLLIALVFVLLRRISETSSAAGRCAVGSATCRSVGDRAEPLLAHIPLSLPGVLLRLRDDPRCSQWPDFDGRHLHQYGSSRSLWWAKST